MENWVRRRFLRKMIANRQTVDGAALLAAHYILYLLPPPFSLSLNGIDDVHEERNRVKDKAQK